jgi:hypothetical protein
MLNKIYVAYYKLLTLRQNDRETYFKFKQSFKIVLLKLKIYELNSNKIKIYELNIIFFKKKTNNNFFFRSENKIIINLRLLALHIRALLSVVREK